MSWRVAKSILHLFAELNAQHPGRSIASDGTIGDAAHASRDSDHNPWVKDGTMGIVTAGDVTHDPAHGVNCNVISEVIRGRRDRRVKYIIWNRRICRSYAKGTLSAWQWGPYSGTNAHTKHMHVSVQPEKALYDSANDWLPTLPVPPKDDDMTQEQYEQIMKFLITISGNVAVLMTRELTDDADKNRRIEELKRLMEAAL